MRATVLFFFNVITVARMAASYKRPLTFEFLPELLPSASA